MKKHRNSKAGKRIGFAAVVEIIQAIILSQAFLNGARKRPQDFTRKRKMPFTDLIAFMLNGVKTSIQTGLDRFFEKIGREGVHMSQQAFSEAREKLRWEAFRDMSAPVVNAIYGGYYETWHGYRVMAIDGSKLQLPDDQKLRDYFGTIGKKSTAATAQGSALYDMLNNVMVDTRIEPMSTGERKLAQMHVDALVKLQSFGKELIIFDRGYASFELIESLRNSGISFLMRVREKFSTAIDALPKGDHQGVRLQKKGHEDIPLRVIKFDLPSGEAETLITDITDKRMGVQAFKELYFKRWPIETKYDEVKNKLQVENFSGRTVDAVKQDFYITMFMSNVVAVACWEAQEEVDGERALKDNKYEYHTNASHAVGTLKDRFIEAILEPSPRKRRRMVARILYLLKYKPAPTRPGRSLPRNPYPRKAKFRHNRKSNC
jgi:hypothetical protein